MSTCAESNTGSAGFELAIPFRGCRLSRTVPSATRPRPHVYNNRIPETAFRYTGIYKMEREGFGPPDALRHGLFSRQVPSASQPSLPLFGHYRTYIIHRTVGGVGFEPTISCSQGRRGRPGCATPRSLKQYRAG